MIFTRSSKLRYGTLAMMEIIWKTITGVSSGHGDFRFVKECLSREGMSIVSCGSVSQQSDPGIGMYIWGLWHVNCDRTPVTEYGNKGELMQVSHTEDSRRPRAHRSWECQHLTGHTVKVETERRLRTQRQ